MTIYQTTSRAARRAAAALLGAAALAAAACGDRFFEPNRNQPSPTGAQNDPNFVQFAVTGILAANRNSLDDYVLQTGIFGREAFNYTQTEGRNTSGYLATFTDNAGFGAGGNWFSRYNNLRNIYNLNQFVATSSLFDAAGRSAIAGFSATLEANELSYVAATRDTITNELIPVETRADPLDLAPFVSRDSVFNYIAARYNAGDAALGQGGGSFPFTLTAGFAGFNTPATFRQFNRALYARLQAYRASTGCGTACYQQALTALGQSFIAPAGALDLGVYAIYSTAANDATNALNTFGGAARVIVAHPSAGREFLTKPDGTPDNRYAAKFVALATPVNAPGQNIGIPTQLGLRIYPTQDARVPVIRNEELILLRAEARYFTGDVAGALEDINTVRTRSGGLAPIAASAIATRDQFVTELLAQRRWSLYLEGQRWIDHRRFGRLNQLPVDLPSQAVAYRQVIPQQECLSRRQLGLEPPPTCPRS